MPELKPCPSCGSKHDPNGNSLVILHRDGYPCTHYVTCRWCGMSGPRRRGEDVYGGFPDYPEAEIARDNLAKQEAIDAWNALPRHVEPQPIETAPRDGTWILAWRDTFPCWIPVFWWDDSDWIDMEGRKNIALGVTHWLPMPPLPEGK